MTKRNLVCVAFLAAMAFPASYAEAAENDLVLSRFSTFDPQQFGDCPNACGIVQPNRQHFENLVGDLGQVFGPKVANPAETLGQAGFTVNAMTALSFIPNDEEYWQLAVEDRRPNSSLFTGHLQVRKGLPFSFEVAGNMGYLFASSMFTLGADVKWALNEGYYYFPDIAIRGGVNTLMGSRDLNLVTAGGDLSISKRFGFSGVMALTPFAGYQMLWTIGSSRLLNAYPQDPRPPQFDSDNPSGPNSATFSPEFVFEQYTATANRFFVGARFNVWILNFVAEGMFGDILQVTFAGGVDF